MGRGFLHTSVAAGLAWVVLAGCGLGSAPDRPVTVQPTAAERPDGRHRQPPPVRGEGGGEGGLRQGRPAWVSVAVATLWRSPRSPRPVDAPALAHPVEIERWLADLTLVQRRALSGRADTQALLGDRVEVLRLRGRWARVVLGSQPAPADVRGYPGWVPRRQLTAVAPATAARRATVVNRTAWLSSDASDPVRLFRVSIGTSLPVAGLTRDAVRVFRPGGGVGRLDRSSVAVRARGEPAREPSRRSLVRTARTFLGLPYLWAGASGFGVDCSGLTWLDFRLHGITIPRDAAPQSEGGRVVTTPRPGDLRFYARDGVVHHVTMSVGHGRMIHAPGTGEVVQVVSASILAGEYAGARRYLP